MTHGSLSRNPRIAFLDTHAHLPAAADFALLVAVTVTKWTQRRKARQAMKNLPDHIYSDIGVPKHAAQVEAEKPFWRD